MHTTGLHHIIMTVSDVERSRRFYEDVLGFETRPRGGDPARGFVFASGGVMYFLVPSPQPVPGDRFSEFRIGLDHLAFAAPSRKDLHELADLLIKAGVDTKGVEQFGETGFWYVAFRDPDNIQLEYWHPERSAGVGG